MAHYKDTKEIYFLHIIHEVKMERALKKGWKDLSGSKLSLANDYNKYMGGIDLNDTLIGNYTSVRKTYQWTIKVVIHFIDEAVCFQTITQAIPWKNPLHELPNRSHRKVSSASAKCASATDKTNTDPKIHFVKSVQIRSSFWSVFSCIRIQSEYRKIRSRNNSVFGHISRKVMPVKDVERQLLH